MRARGYNYTRMVKFLSESVEDTINFARQYARTLNKGDVVLLEGELGAGKTVFAKGVALGLGITDEVLSPTYAYMNDYSGVLYHYDCYRLSGGEAATALGLCDYFGGDGICLIEWAENIKDVLPEGCKKVIIKAISDKKREIICE